MWELIWGLGLALILGYAALRWIGPKGFMDLPSGRKQHTHPVPRVGGLALVVCMVLGEALGFLNFPLSPLQWTLLAAVAVVGALDDRYNLRAAYKAWISLGVSLVLAITTTIEIYHGVDDLKIFEWIIPHDPWLIGGLLLILFWATPHALNLIDGADGLLLGYSLVAFLAIAGVFGQHLFVVGALLGFLALNWPRAKMFMGDCGALVLGFLIAMLAQSVFTPARLEGILWVLAYPAIDLLMVVVIRVVNKRPLGDGDRNHLHHHWKEALGAHSRYRVPLLWGQAGLCASGAWLSGWWMLLPMLGLAFLMGSASFFALRACRKSHKSGCNRVRATGEVVKAVQE